MDDRTIEALASGEPDPMEDGKSYCKQCETIGRDHLGECDEDGSLSVEAMSAFQ